MKRIITITFLLAALSAFSQTLTVQPNVASKGQSLTIMFSGTNLNFGQGTNTSWVYFTQGSSTIYPGQTYAYDNDHMSATFDIPTYVNCGNYTALVFGQGSNTLQFPNKLTIDCSTNISGHVYRDNDGNGFNNGEPGMKFATILVQPGNIVAQTDYFGDYSIPIAPGNYTVDVVLPNYHTQTSLPAVHTANTIVTSDIQNLDFGLFPSVHNDLSVYLSGPNPRAGFNRTFWVTITNNGTTLQNPDIQLTLDNDLSVSSCQHPFTSSGNVYSINLPNINLDYQDSYTFSVELLAAVNAPFGNQVQIIATITNALTPEETPADNSYIAYRNYTNSYDPNDKQVEPAGRGPNKEVLRSETLKYQVRFQNTGNDVAYLVRIIDTLDANLDLSTFKLLGNSHPVEYSLSANGVVVFTFNNINLPDSGSGGALSNGFVSYSIRIKPSLPEGTVIANTAYIYFDFNPPVITNTTASKMVTTYSGINDINNDISLLIYPNPSSDVLNVWTETATVKEFYLYDAAGKMLHSEQIGSKQFKVNTSGLKSGIYMLKIAADEGTVIKRFSVIK